MNKLIPIFAIILAVTITGCKGCSQSGLRSEQRKAGSRVTSESDYKAKKSQQHSSSSTLSDLFNRHKSAIFLVYTSNDKDTFQGSGFFVSPNGIAVSNYHIFEDTFKGNEVIVTYAGEELGISSVLEKSKEKDYIIFKVKEAKGVNYLAISVSRPAIGEDVLAIGNPRGLEHTLSKGIVSGYRKENQYIQTTAEITHGSSGGALLNMKGEVIGITSSGLGEANLNFAINIQELPLGKFIR